MPCGYQSLMKPGSAQRRGADDDAAGHDYAPPMALPAEVWKLDDISPKAYQHPADRATTAALANVPYLDQVVRKLVALGYERSLRTATLGAAVRLGDNQLPHVHKLQREVFNVLDHEPVPDLYMTQYPMANAFTGGSEKPVVVVNSEIDPAAGRGRPARGAGPRGRARALRPRALPDRAGHPQAAGLGHGGAHPDAGRPADGGRRTTRCWSGRGRPSSAATAPPRWSPATRRPSATRSWSSPPARPPTTCPWTPSSPRAWTTRTWAARPSSRG